MSVIAIPSHSAQCFQKTQGSVTHQNVRIALGKASEWSLQREGTDTFLHNYEILTHAHKEPGNADIITPKIAKQHLRDDFGQNIWVAKNMDVCN